MAISEQREFEVQVGGRAIVPRSIYDPIYRSFLDLRKKTIFDSPNATPLGYSSFPRCPAFRDVAGTLIGMTVDGEAIVLWSDGASHGDSDRVLLALVDPVTLAVQSSILREGSGALTPSILNGKLALGQNLLMARFLLQQPSGGGAVTGTVMPIQSYVVSGAGATSRPISPWSRPKLLASGEWVRMGYQTDTADSPAVLLTSLDNQKTWAFKSTVAYNAAKRFRESDVVEVSPGNLLAWVSELDPTDATRPIWWRESTDSGATWGALTLYSDISGVQPQLDLLVNGMVQGMVADRDGTSGLSRAGMPIDNTRNKTGIAHFISLDGSATDFRYRTMLAQFLGTDGGQAATVEYAPGEMFFMHYGVRRADELSRVVAGRFTLEKLHEGYV